jgi:MFS family permease
VFDTYRAAFRVPGTRAFCAAAFLMRMPISMYPIGLVLLVSIRTGHYGFAGLLSGVYVLANGFGNPALGRVVDRLGQSRVLVPGTAAHGAGIVAVCLLAGLGAPDWSLLVPTAIAGFCYLPVGSLVRARWSYALADRPELGAAYSLESTLDEVIFTVGPLIIAVVATQLDPVLGLLLGVAFVVTGSWWLRRLRGSEPPVHPAEPTKHRSAVRYRGMVLMTLAAAGMGGVFASAELSMVAFCGQHGATGASGLMLACFAFGSGVAGLIYGARPRLASVSDRFRQQALVFGTLTLVFLAAVNVAVLAGCAFVVGLGIAPMLITAFTLIARIVPAASLTEGMSWLTTGLSFGYGIAAAIVGRVADAHGARAGFLLTIGCGVVLGIVALTLHRRIGHRELASRPELVGTH